MKPSVSPGQLLMVGFRPEEEGQLLSLVAKGRVGGVILFGRNGEDALEVARLCELLRRAAREGPHASIPLVAVDQEQGRVCRIRRGVTRFPGASVLGTLDRPDTTARVARWVGLELKALGIHLNLAPVGDVTVRGRASRALEGRTFGFEPERVASHVKAWIRGSQGAGMAACAKHFPGHGAVREDSHIAMPRDPTPLPVLRRDHLRPFLAAIRAGVSAIMVGHVAYDALEPGVPASLSRRVIQGLLRQELGYQGLVLTDDLEMGAVSRGRDPVEAAIQAIGAGADMALVGRNLTGETKIESLLSGLGEALRTGRLAKDRVAASARRVLLFKRRWIPARWELPPGPPAALAAGRLARRLELRGRGGGK